MNPPKSETRWIYVGPGDGKGEVHTVLSAGWREITTWGDLGHTWLGSNDEFHKCFKPQPEEAGR